MICHFVLFAVLAIGTVHFSGAQQVPGARCDQLPKADFNIKDLTKVNPYVYHYYINSVFECAQQLSVEPLKGKRGYDGTIFALQGSSFVSYDFTASADNKSADVTDCNSGQRFTWFALNSNITPTGGWYCIYTCATDGLALEDFFCAATDQSFFKDETAAVALTRGIPNAGNVKDARISCNAAKFCRLV